MKSIPRKAVDVDVNDLPPAPGKFASTVKVGEKGQIVIPKEARELFNIRPGDTLLLLADVEQGIVIVRQDMFEQFIAQAMPPAPRPPTVPREDAEQEDDRA